MEDKASNRENNDPLNRTYSWAQITYPYTLTDTNQPSEHRGGEGSAFQGLCEMESALPHW